MIGNFAVRGGTVIVAHDGMANDQIPSLTYRVLVGTRSVQRRLQRNQTGQQIVYGPQVSDPGLQNGVPDGYPGPQYTVSFHSLRRHLAALVRHQRRPAGRAPPPVLTSAVRA